MDQRFEGLGFGPADILLPQERYMDRWAVVACDQFTSQPEHWQEAEALVGDAPSALRLILPEVWLNEPDVERRISAINTNMERYWVEGVFRTLPESLVYLEREQSDGRTRHGLVGRIDLEAYALGPDPAAQIRATEGTVLERIPPRIRVREHAALELPHVMLLIDDPAGRVLKPLAGETDGMEPLYDAELMQGGGHVHGWRLTEAQVSRTAEALRDLKAQTGPEATMLFAVGDGNHSLAAAKACYEQWKAATPPDRWSDLPARYALVEVVDLHDDALTFAPIHRALFHVDAAKVWEAFRAFYPDAHVGQGTGHSITVCDPAGETVWTVPAPAAQLAVGTLQTFLDDYIQQHPETEIDYIHGDGVARELGRQPGNMAFLLPPMDKADLFPTVIHDGALPRKTFSMGEAQDKRYYLEARRIR